MVLVRSPIPLPLPLRVVFCAFLSMLRTTLNFAFQVFPRALLEADNQERVIPAPTVLFLFKLCSRSSKAMSCDSLQMPIKIFRGIPSVGRALADRQLVWGTTHPAEMLPRWVRWLHAVAGGG